MLISFACNKSDDANLSFDKVSGLVQKGPYLAGGEMTLTGITESLMPNGTSFTAQILDNKGTFEFRQVNLGAPYAEVKADGFYFDEVKNVNSSAQLILYALSDLSDGNNINVNVLTDLEKGRVEYLMEQGLGFTEAEAQAQQEVLAIFNISKTGMEKSERLDVSATGDDNAILLAISVILQGYQSVSGLSELLANINTDIREDGVLDSHTLGTMLINNARAIHPDQIRTNLQNRYEAMGLDITVPDFEKYVNQFIANTDYEFSGFIQYPETGNSGLNILDKNKADYAVGSYSMKAVLPEGASLKVKIKGPSWAFPAFQDNTGWIFTDWDATDQSRVFTATRSGSVDFEIMLNASHNTTSVAYTYLSVYENGDVDPTWTKTIAAK